MRTLIPAGNKSSVRAKLFDIFLDSFVEAGDERSNKHDDTDAEHHAKYSKRAAHLVSAQGIHGLFQIFTV
jgi:hypothetical protein